MFPSLVLGHLQDVLEALGFCAGKTSYSEVLKRLYLPISLTCFEDGNPCKVNFPGRFGGLTVSNPKFNIFVSIQTRNLDQTSRLTFPIDERYHLTEKIPLQPESIIHCILLLFCGLDGRPLPTAVPFFPPTDPILNQRNMIYDPVEGSSSRPSVCWSDFQVKSRKWCVDQFHALTETA